MSDFICKPSQYSLLRRANLHGFAGLPDELFLEILSHFPPNPVTISAASKTEVIRRETLRSLSEVCQNLRRVFRPHLWQRVEVYAGMLAGGQRLNHPTMSCSEQRMHHSGCNFSEPRPKPTKYFAKELLRQLNVVTVQDPDLAQDVRIVDIEVNATTFRPVFDELGRCFSLFPNLHTVKIITRFSQNHKPDEGAMAAVKRGFKKKISYPQIRSAILSPSVYPLLAVCPNLESLTTFEESPFLVTFIKGLPALQKLSCPLFLFTAAEIAEELPSLQQISLSLVDSSGYRDDNYTRDLIRTIRLFPNLRTLIFHHDPPTPNWPFASRKTLMPVFVNLPPLDRQNLKRVIFLGHSGQQEEVLFL